MLPKPLDLGYGSSLSQRSKGKQKQTVFSDELSTKQICRLQVKHDKMKLSCFCLLADPYT